MNRVSGVVAGEERRYRLVQMWCDTVTRAEYFLATTDGKITMPGGVCYDFEHYTKPAVHGLLIRRMGEQANSFDISFCPVDRCVRVALESARIPVTRIESLTSRARLPSTHD